METPIFFPRSDTNIDNFSLSDIGLKFKLKLRHKTQLKGEAKKMRLALELSLIKTPKSRPNQAKIHALKYIFRTLFLKFNLSTLNMHF